MVVELLKKSVLVFGQRGRASTMRAKRQRAELTVISSLVVWCVGLAAATESSVTIDDMALFRIATKEIRIKMYIVPHHPFTHEQATPSGDFLEKNHENLS